MKISFFAYYRDREYAGCKEIEWTEETKDLRQLLNQLGDRYGAKFRGELLSPDGNAVGEKSIIMINGRRVDFLQGIDTPLKNTDHVLIFPVVAGG